MSLFQKTLEQIQMFFNKGLNETCSLVISEFPCCFSNDTRLFDLSNKFYGRETAAL